MESSKHELGENKMIPSSNYLVTSPVPTIAPRDVSHVLNDKHQHLWKIATCEQHDKNHKLLVLSIPFIIQDAPKDKFILRPVLESAVNTTVSEPDIYCLCTHPHANGANQKADLEK